MDLTQTPSGSTEPRTIDVNFPISDARNETSAAGAEQTKQTATIGVTQAQKTPLPAGTTGLSVPERTKPHVWNWSGERKAVIDTTSRTQTQPISLLPLAPTREEMAELWSMDSTQMDKSRALRSHIGPLPSRKRAHRTSNRNPREIEKSNRPGKSNSHISKTNSRSIQNTRIL